MPFISRLFIKAGMIYFILSLLTALLLEIEALFIPPLIPLFWHMLMLGWITQIIMGVSVWMYPGRNREEGFWNQKWSWLTFILLNVGLVLRVIAEPAMAYTEAALWKGLLVVSALTQLGAGGTYLAEIWPRILSKKKQRERRKRMRNS